MNRIFVCFAISTLAICLGCTASQGGRSSGQYAGKIDPVTIDNEAAVYVPEQCLLSKAEGTPPTSTEITAALARTVCRPLGFPGFFVDYADGKRRMLVIHIDPKPQEVEVDGEVYWQIEVTEYREESDFRSLDGTAIVDAPGETQLRDFDAMKAADARSANPGFLDLSASVQTIPHSAPE